MNTTKATKTEDSKTIAIDPIWCDYCNIRIAPYEQGVGRARKNYHQQCLKKIEAGKNN